MAKKVIISKKQCALLVNYIKESSNQSRIVSKVTKFLDSSYQPAIGTIKKGGEYHDKAMIKNLINNEMMQAKDLLEYLQYKFEGLSEEFLKQVIRDWFNGKLQDTTSLSKNVKTMN